MAKSLQIAGVTFEVSTPYAEGHVCNEAEAKTLNQTRAENVGNNLREEIKAAIAEGKSQADMQALVSAYDAEYVLSMGGTRREPVDPLEKEIERVAKEAITANLAEAGKKFKDMSDEWKNDAIEKVSQLPNIVEEAKKRLKAKQKKAKVNLAELGIAA